MKERRRHETRELTRLTHLTQGSAWQFRRLYLKRTMRALPRELELLRQAKLGPGFVIRVAQNGKRSRHYDLKEVIAFFGGEAAIFHRRDQPEVFGPHDARVLPSHRPA